MMVSLVKPPSSVINSKLQVSMITLFFKLLPCEINRGGFTIRFYYKYVRLIISNTFLGSFVYQAAKAKLDSQSRAFLAAGFYDLYNSFTINIQM